MAGVTSNIQEVKGINRTCTNRNRVDAQIFSFPWLALCYWCMGGSRGQKHG